MLTWMAQAMRELSLPAQLLLVGWLLTMITVPILRWIWGARAQTWGVGVSVLLQAATVIGTLIPAWGTARTLRTAVLIVAMGWGVEFLGSKTGFPFGRYSYTERLQPQLGEVPLLIPLAWLMILPPAWAVAAIIAGDSPFEFVVVAALAFTAWDLFLDPQMVAWGMWTWDDPAVGGGAPRLFGIPWTNYAGWFGAAALMTWITLPGTAPVTTPVAPLLLIYGLTWFLEAFGQLLFWGLPGPALTGGLTMGAFLLWSALRL